MCFLSNATRYVCKIFFACGALVPHAARDGRALRARRCAPGSRPQCSAQVSALGPRDVDWKLSVVHRHATTTKSATFSWGRLL